MAQRKEKAECLGLIETKRRFAHFNRTMNYVSHYHDYFEIMVVMKPNLLHILNEKEIVHNRCDIVVIRPDIDIHSVKPVDIKKSVQVWEIFAEKSFFKNVCNFLSDDIYERIMSADEPPQFTVSENELLSIELTLNQPMFSGDTKLNLENSLQNDAMKRAVLCNILGIYVRLQCEKEINLKKQIISILKETRLRKPHEIKVQTIADNLNYSREHLEREFKAAFGISIKQYLTEQRLSLAAQQLIYTDLPITKIMQDNGWNKSSNFYDVFRKHYGMSPKEYRKIHKEKS